MCQLWLCWCGVDPTPPVCDLGSTGSLTSGPRRSSLTWAALLTADVSMMQCCRNKLFPGFKINQEIPENDINFKNSWKFNRSSDWNNLYMKNYQKNSIYPSVPFSCMINHLYMLYIWKHTYGIFKSLIWSCIWTLVQMDFNQINARCINSSNITYSCHVHAS